MIRFPRGREKQPAANRASARVSDLPAAEPHDSDATRLEKRAQEYGRQIFVRIDLHGPLPCISAWFDDRLMNLTMSEEALKVQLFRFIDTLPLLRDSESIADHLREYLEEAGRQLPWWVRLGTKLL